MTDAGRLLESLQRAVDALRTGDPLAAIPAIGDLSALHALRLTSADATGLQRVAEQALALAEAERDRIGSALASFATSRRAGAAYPRASRF
jgi:hypothetical protein